MLNMLVWELTLGRGDGKYKDVLGYGELFSLTKLFFMDNVYHRSNANLCTLQEKIIK